jgi:hypothetical protein
MSRLSDPGSMSGRVFARHLGRNTGSGEVSIGASDLQQNAEHSRRRTSLMETEVRRPLNLLWLRQTLEMVLEGHFIKELLLAEIGRPIRTIMVEPNAPIPILSDALIVSFGTQLAGYLKEARERGCTNIGLFHMADEHGDQDRSFYGFADYVLRHYWFKHALVVPNPHSLGVIWVPNGYRNGVGPIMPQTMLTIADRRIMGFFSGALEARTLSDERRQMLKVIQDAKLPFAIYSTPGFAQGFGPVSYAAYLCMSRFGLVPSGNSHETIRLYEVLEAGAIPIMLRSPFVSAPDALGNPPFVLLNNWSELAAAYAPYAEATKPRVVEELEEKRKAVLAWWIQFKATQQRRVKDLIDQSFARTHDSP